jgi:hypothetical protein
MNPNTDAFVKLVKHPIKFRIFLFTKIPSAFFSGVRVRDIGPNGSKVSVPYKWFSQNPFRSTYFACLAMAAEMSTGVLSLMHVYKRDPSVSMLVTGMSASYYKKALGLTTFACEDGQLIGDAVEKAIAGGEGQTVTAKSRGTNPEGELVAEFEIVWSFKVKMKNKSS